MVKFTDWTVHRPALKSLIRQPYWADPDRSAYRLYSDICLVAVFCCNVHLLCIVDGDWAKTPKIAELSCRTQVHSVPTIDHLDRFIKSFLFTDIGWKPMSSFPAIGAIRSGPKLRLRKRVIWKNGSVRIRPCLTAT